MGYQYSDRRRKQYVVKYRKDGLWFTQFFATAEKASAFRLMMRVNPRVDLISRVGVLYQ